MVGEGEGVLRGVLRGVVEGGWEGGWKRVCERMGERLGSVQSTTLSWYPRQGRRSKGVQGRSEESK